LLHAGRPLRLHGAARRAGGLARLPAAWHRLRRDGDQLLPRPRDPGAGQPLQARPVAARLLHLDEPQRLGDQGVLPHPAQPRHRARQPDPGVMARQTLVLLPGLLNTRRLYERQIADLADLADAVVPDLWHHDTIAAMAEATLAMAPERFALGGF